MPHELVSAYTLVVGEDEDQPSVTVHTTADDAWRALDREIRERCGMRTRPRRAVDADGASRLADAWRAADPESRYWQVTAHRLPIMLPELARPRAVAER
ncbi:hypothetical protein [Pseudonocardia sp. KRD291]|uniref:hypothetical protein n=1 Tax=Pseudonocardia sp. KRD291 TaxID=2792007 RepID=UPI001C49ECCC|nr:hypothetical protein [Pseudonocardia sp. KRD291]MBW0104925.1 hypothetical protein [Pseudonocardia sp. KRD291]